ncbi:MAG: hypothetical protein IPP18_00675 [Rhodocyclaceae bacterium]|nr:hypothetical protein [Rhodocyclaceae bacterium]
MKNLQTGHRTEVSYLGADYDLGIEGTACSPSVFCARRLASGLIDAAAGVGFCAAWLSGVLSGGVTGPVAADVTLEGFLQNLPSTPRA